MRKILMKFYENFVENIRKNIKKILKTCDGQGKVNVLWGFKIRKAGTAFSQQLQRCIFFFVLNAGLTPRTD